MSMFRCDNCDEIKDADDGCDESPLNTGGFGLICIDCMEEFEAAAEEADDFRRANPLDPDFRRLDQ